MFNSNMDFPTEQHPSSLPDQVSKEVIELPQTPEELQRMLRETKESGYKEGFQKASEALIATVGHYLGNAVTSGNGYTELYQGKIPPPEIIKEIFKSIEKTATYIQSFGKITEDTPLIPIYSGASKTMFDLDKVIEDDPLSRNHSNNSKH